MKIFILKFFALMSLSGCGSDNIPQKTSSTRYPPSIPNKSPITQSSSLDCATGTSLTYNNFGQSFMLTYCSQCHSSVLPENQRFGAPLGMDFDTAEQILNFRNRIILVAASPVSNTMPPTNFVTKEERDLLYEWLQCGAPLGTDQQTP